MKKIFALSFLFLLFYTTTSAQERITPQISVSGKAEVSIEPDIIQLTIHLGEGEGNKKMPLQQKEQVLFGILKQLNIDKQQLTLVRASNDFDKGIWKKDELLTSKTYNLTVNNAKHVHQLFASLKEKGLSPARINKIDYSKMPELMRKVRIQAIQAAKEKAEYLTEAIGHKIGKALRIKENFNRNWRLAQVSNSIMSDDSMLSLAGGTDIALKKIQVSAEINVDFEIL